MHARDSDDESDHDLISTEMLEDIYDSSQSLIRTLIKEKPVIKSVILLGRDNCNGNERQKLHETWVKFYTRYLRLL